jgi:hypothetical protein
VKCLIALGADVNSKTSSNQSVLELAKSDEMCEVIKYEMQKKIDKQQEINEKKSQNKDDLSPYDSIAHSSSNNLDKTSIDDDDEEIYNIGEEGESMSHSTSSNAVKDDHKGISTYVSTAPEGKAQNLDAPDTENNVINNEIQSIGPCGLIVSDLPVHALAVSSVSESEIFINENISKENEDSLLGVRKMPSKISQKRKKVGRFSGQSFVLSHLNEDEETEN